jgi:hypothetical protein
MERRILLCLVAFLLPVAGRFAPAAMAPGAERMVAQLGIALTALLWCLSGELAGRLFVRGSRRVAAAAGLLGGISFLHFAFDSRLEAFVTSMDVLVLIAGFLAASQVFGTKDQLRSLAKATGSGVLFCMVWSALARPSDGAASWICGTQIMVLPALLLGAISSYALGRAGFELGPGVTRGLTAGAGSLALLVLLIQGSWMLGQWHAARARAQIARPDGRAGPRSAVPAGSARAARARAARGRSAG